MFKPKQTVDCVAGLRGRGRGRNRCDFGFRRFELPAAKEKTLSCKASPGLVRVWRMSCGWTCFVALSLKVQSDSHDRLDGRPVWFVKPELIFDERGRPDPRGFGQSHAEASPFAGIGRRQLIPTRTGSLSAFGFSSFSKMREDKAMDSGGARIEQAMKKAKPPAKLRKGLSPRKFRC